MIYPQQPKVFGVKFSVREIWMIFPINVRKVKLWKMTKLLNFRFPYGWYFLNCDNTELKRSSKICCCFRTASLRGSGLICHTFKQLNLMLSVDELLIFKTVTQRVYTYRYLARFTHLVNSLTKYIVWKTHYFHFSTTARTEQNQRMKATKWEGAQGSIPI